MIGIYLITNKVNGNRYVGQSVNIEKRTRDHFSAKAMGHGSLLKNDIDRYGKDALRDEKFRAKVSEGVKRWWRNLPETTKTKIVKGLTGPRIGHKVSAKTRQLLREANFGKKKHRRVVLLETNQVFDSAEDCARYLGVTHSAVCYNLRGKTKLTKGFSIEYLRGVETMGDECNPVGPKMSCGSKCVAP